MFFYRILLLDKVHLKRPSQLISRTTSHEQFSFVSWAMALFLFISTTILFKNQIPYLLSDILGCHSCWRLACKPLQTLKLVTTTSSPVLPSINPRTSKPNLFMFLTLLTVVAMSLILYKTLSLHPRHQQVMHMYRTLVYHLLSPSLLHDPM